MTVRKVPIIGCILAGSIPAHASFSGIQWLDQSLFQRITISGRRILGYHSHNVSGDRDAFNSLTYYGEGTRQFTDNGHMSIVGRKVFGILNFDMQLADDRYEDPQARKIWLDYQHKGLRLGYGDLDNARLLNTNQFATFTKSLRGASVGYDGGRLSVRAIRSEAKSAARTASIQGNNSVGPYYLGASQIINDSEEVRIDGQPMKLGQDYTVNYELGSITFVNRVIPPTSTIVVAFETLGTNTGRGTIQGASLAYDFGKIGRIGLTQIEQKTGGSVGLGTRSDGFWGFGPASLGYPLTEEPLPTKPIVVKLNGVVQVLGVDYVFGQSDGQTIYQVIYFLRDVPQSMRIDVTYTPKPVQTLSGDRKVLGIDYRLPLGKDRGFLSYSQATGELQNEFNPLSGTARGIRGEYRLKNLSFYGSAVDIPRGFVAPETRGFNRNERSSNLGVEYQRGALSMGADMRNSSISSLKPGSGGDYTFNVSRAATASAYLRYRPSNGATWSLEQYRTSARYLGHDSQIDTTSFSVSKAFGKLNTSLGLNHQTGYGPIQLNGGAVKDGSLTLDTLKLTADYATANGWYFGTRTSVSSIKSLGNTGKGNDITVATSYQPGKGPFSFQSSYTVSDSGELATLGTFVNGSGIGYADSGFNSGSPTAGLYSGQSNVRLLTFSPTYRFGEKGSLTGRFYQSRYSGAFNSNTETMSYGLGFDYELGNNHVVALSVDKSSTQFVGLSNRSDSLTYSFNLVGAPKGPWSYHLGLTGLLSGNSSEFAQDSMGFDGNLRYKLTPRQALNFQFNFGRTTGYYPQSENQIWMSYEHQLYRNVALVGSYKWRSVRNLSDTLTSGAYRSSGFDLELSFNFGG